MINKCPTARKLSSQTGAGTGLEYFACAYAFIAYPRVDAREKALSLLIAAVMVVEAAGIGPAQRVAENFLIPRLFDFRRAHSHLAIVVQELHADINAFIADITRVSLEETCDFTIGEAAE